MAARSPILGSRRSGHLISVACGGPSSSSSTRRVPGLTRPIAAVWDGCRCIAATVPQQVTCWRTRPALHDEITPPTNTDMIYAATVRGVATLRKCSPQVGRLSIAAVRTTSLEEAGRSSPHGSACRPAKCAACAIHQRRSSGCTRSSNFGSRRDRASAAALRLCFSFGHCLARDRHSARSDGWQTLDHQTTRSQLDPRRLIRCLNASEIAGRVIPTTFRRRHP